MRQYIQIISVCILLIISYQTMYAETDYFIQNIAVDILRKMCKVNSSQLPIKVSQTDAFTAMDIRDGYLTYYYSSNLQGEGLDYVMNNKKLIYDNLLAQIVSTPFTTALCIDAKIGIRYRYTFTYNRKDMDIDITNSTLTDILPPLNQDVIASDQMYHSYHFEMYRAYQNEMYHLYHFQMYRLSRLTRAS